MLSEWTVEEEPGRILVPLLVVGAVQSPELCLTLPLPLQVNVMLVLVTLLTFAHPVLMYLECRQKAAAPAATF